MEIITDEFIQEVEDNISEEVSGYFFDNDIFSIDEIADVLAVVMEQLGFDDVDEILDALDSELSCDDSSDFETPIMDAIAQLDRS